MADAADNLAEVLGRDHPHTLGCAANLVIIDLRVHGHADQERADAAIDAVADRVGTGHPDVRTLRHARPMRSVIPGARSRWPVGHPTGAGIMRGVEILPGVGVDAVKIGEQRATVEGRLGKPAPPGRGSKAVYESDPMLVVTYDADDAVELVEAGYGGAEVFFGGIQLTHRFMDDVLADLARLGHAGTPFDIGYVFEPGFAIFSMASLSAQDLDPTAAEDDERDIVEGVAIAPRAYFDYGPPEDATDEELDAWLQEHGLLPGTG
jgi:hypothetical protein